MEDLITISTNTQFKVKQLKELIKEKAPSTADLSEIPPERLQLQIEGGDVLKKSTAMLDEVGLKDNQVLIVTISDKSGASQASRERKAKEEPKVPIIYTLKHHTEEEGEE